MKKQKVDHGMNETIIVISLMSWWSGLDYSFVLSYTRHSKHTCLADGSCLAFYRDEEQVDAAENDNLDNLKWIYNYIGETKLDNGNGEYEIELNFTGNTFIRYIYSID